MKGYGQSPGLVSTGAKRVGLLFMIEKGEMLRSLRSL